MSELITVASQRDLQSDKEYINIRVDGASVLSNPFDFTDQSSRDKACDAYAEWLILNMQTALTADTFIHVSLEKWILQGLSISQKYKNPHVQDVARQLKLLLGLLQCGQKLKLICSCRQSDERVRCHADSIKLALEKMYQHHHRLQNIA
ncbi:hypothetical protein CLI64_26470 [Nostoc sp. CENA543]|uniref:DUF4326 domain-containing protein n=1 Tax=Nostoc sp. CENA543 TaxID=1869241 RepID=UPI000CA1CA3B|nr:DUF4326 domain-containing protein [Nostoc sp. CENA543]AUT03652.1 hypothetical protein CLI64_26470 [Nostoc sp. CENA543]